MLKKDSTNSFYLFSLIIIMSTKVGETIGRVVREWVLRHDLDYILPSLDTAFMDRLVESSRDDMKEEEIISLLSFVSGSLASHDPKWDFFSAEVLMGMHSDVSPKSFMEVVTILQENTEITGKTRPLLEEDFVAWILDNQVWIEDLFEKEIRRSKMFPMTLFGWKTLYKSYLMRSNGKVIERPDHMWFRVALFLHRDHQERVASCFQDLRMGKYTHATPTLYYAGARRPQMASCFPWNAIVYTPHGGKPISKIDQGDLVLSHTGTWKPVQQVHHDVLGNDRKMVQIGFRDRVLDVTDDHEFLMQDGEYRSARSAGFSPENMVRVDASFFQENKNKTIATSENDRGGLVLFREPTEEEETKNDWVEYRWSVECPSRIPALLTNALKDRGWFHKEKLDELRKRWRVYGSTYLNMWYEQWLAGIVFSDSATTTTTTTSTSFVTRYPETPMTEKVYTLTVEEDHSYVVHGCIAKNCFLVGTDDSIEGIFKTLSDVAQISKWAGGLGIHISNIRADRSYIYGTNGYSNGILPMIRLFNDTSRYIDQCFSPETWVWTENRGWEEIASLRPGDSILTGSGKYAMIERVLSHVIGDTESVRSKRREMVSVSGWKKREVFVTPGHDFLIDEQEQEYVPIGELSASCSVHMSHVPSAVGLGMGTQTQTHWTPQWAHLLAVFIRSGSLIEVCPSTMDWEVRDTSIMEDMRDILRDNLMVEWKGANIIEWKVRLYPWTWDRGGKWMVPPYEWLRSNDCTECVKKFLEEMDKVDNNNNEEWKRFHASLVYKFDRDRWIRENGWILNQKNKHHVRWGEMSVKKVRGWTGMRENAMVYDLEVEGEDKSYTTEIGTVHNGGGKRNGAFAMYLEPWHADVMQFLGAKKNTGPEEDRARDLFYGLWVPDLFMHRVERNEKWSLMCPKECPGLTEVHGEAFRDLYENYEREGKFRRQISARELFTEILKSQIETGTPYILYKDSCNRKSNQQHLGTIKSSNLCVRGDTMILTKNGYVPIARHVGEAIEVWNGVAFSKVVPLETEKSIHPQEWVKIITERGKRIECTADHIFYVGSESESKPVKASSLEAGMQLCPWSIPVMESMSDEVLEEFQRICGFVSRHANHRILFSADYESLLQMQIILELGGILVSISDTTKTLDGQRRWRMEISEGDWDLIRKEFVSLQSLSTSSTTIPPTVPKMLKVSETVESVVCGSIQQKPMPSFCIREAERHSIVFQGMLTGQCTEIIEYSSASEYAVCNLASISLPACLRGGNNPLKKILISSKADAEVQWAVGRLQMDPHHSSCEVVQEKEVPWDRIRVVGDKEEDNNHDSFYSPVEFFKKYLAPEMDWEELYRLTQNIVINLNEVIDKNRYPTSETRVSNLNHRPVGIGVQGLADVFCALKLPFDSLAARKLNHEIFETIYHAALSASCDLAGSHGSYGSYEGSPISKGLFHWELCAPDKPSYPLLYDWESLRAKILSKKGGMRNSLLVAPMPTASTSQILGNNECFEPYTSNFYTRRTQAGEFLIYNRELYRDLCAMKMWTSETRQELLWNRGSVKNLSTLPVVLREIYKTVWEIPQKAILNLAVDRHFFIDQSQSMNLFLAEADVDTLIKMHFYGFHKGLKTGSYYIRTRPAITASHFTIDRKPVSNPVTNGSTPTACPMRKRGSSKNDEDDEEEVCESCSA